MKRTLKIRNNHEAFSVKNVLVPLLFLLAGAAFLLAGIERGEVSVILRKAITICLECIGIG